MSGRVKRLPVNRDGRDFVVGDIHGAYDAVIEAMKLAAFDREVDRLFSVGDLTDRGAQSIRVLRFLRQPFVHAVRGNHDDDFAQLSLQEIRLLAGINFNGLGWALKHSDDELLAIQASLRDLPLVMEVDTPRGKVGILHAEVPRGMDWPTFVAAVESGDKDVIDSCLTGRERIHSRDERGVDGIGRVFVGHTVMEAGASRLGNVYAIDTGAVFRELRPDDESVGLTMAELTFSTGSLLQTPTVPPVRLIESEDADRPFGAYARPSF